MRYLEKEILGSFMKDNDLLKESNLATHHFSESHHRALYKTMIKLANENKAVDHVTLMTENQKMVMDLGGPEYLLDIETRGNPEKYETYEITLIENYKSIKTKEIVKGWLAKEENDSHQLIADIQKLDDEGITDESNTMDILVELHNEVNQPKSSPITGIPSGLRDLDMLTGGWQPQNSIILGARPSMGKTATMLRFMKGAMDNGDVPIVFSLEMPKKGLIRRMASSLAGINSFMARNPQNLTESQQRKWIEAVGQLSNMDFEIYDKPMQTIQYIRSKVRKEQKKHEGKRIVVLIDYLTLINNSGNFPSDHAKVTDTSARLKAIAKEYNCPVITLAQLSRGVEQRQDKRPMQSDLRESGSIEQDADLILLLYRDDYYNKETENKNQLEINLSKHRDGPVGELTVYYNRSTGRIEDLSS